MSNYSLKELEKEPACWAKEAKKEKKKDGKDTCLRLKDMAVDRIKTAKYYF